MLSPYFCLKQHCFKNLRAPEWRALLHCLLSSVLGKIPAQLAKKQKYPTGVYLKGHRSVPEGAASSRGERDTFLKLHQHLNPKGTPLRRVEAKKEENEDDHLSSNNICL